MRLIARRAMGGNHEAHIIEGADRIWIRVLATEPAQCLGHWSGAPEARMDGPLEEIQRSLDDALRAGSGPTWALEVWPAGWEFWGPQLPAPLSEYLMSAAYISEQGVVALS
jgi:hypothetical protein